MVAGCPLTLTGTAVSSLTLPVTTTWLGSETTELFAGELMGICGRASSVRGVTGGRPPTGGGGARRGGAAAEGDGLRLHAAGGGRGGDRRRRGRRVDERVQRPAAADRELRAGAPEPQVVRVAVDEAAAADADGVRRQDAHRAAEGDDGAAGDGELVEVVRAGGERERVAAAEGEVEVRRAAENALPLARQRDLGVVVGALQRRRQRREIDRLAVVRDSLVRARAGDLAAAARGDGLARTGRGVAVERAAADFDVAVGQDVPRAADDGAGVSLRVDHAVRQGEVTARGKRVRDQRRGDREGVVGVRRERQSRRDEGGERDVGDPITHRFFPFGLVWQPAIVRLAVAAVPDVAVMVTSSFLRPSHDTVTTNDVEMAPSGTMTESGRWTAASSELVSATVTPPRGAGAVRRMTALTVSPSRAVGDASCSAATPGGMRRESLPWPGRASPGFGACFAASDGTCNGTAIGCDVPVGPSRIGSVLVRLAPPPTVFVSKR